MCCILPDKKFLCGLFFIDDYAQEIYSSWQTGCGQSRRPPGNPSMLHTYTENVVYFITTLYYFIFCN